LWMSWPFGRSLLAGGWPISLVRLRQLIPCPCPAWYLLWSIGLAWGIVIAWQSVLSFRKRRLLLRRWQFLRFLLFRRNIFSAREGIVLLRRNFLAPWQTLSRHRLSFLSQNIFTGVQARSLTHFVLASFRAQISEVLNYLFVFAFRQPLQLELISLPLIQSDQPTHSRSGLACACSRLLHEGQRSSRTRHGAVLTGCKSILNISFPTLVTAILPTVVRVERIVQTIRSAVRDPG